MVKIDLSVWLSMHSECTAYRFYLIAVSVFIDIHPRPQYLLVPIIGVSECLPFWRGIFLLSFVTICSPVNSKLRDWGGLQRLGSLYYSSLL